MHISNCKQVILSCDWDGEEVVRLEDEVDGMGGRTSYLIYLIEASIVPILAHQQFAAALPCVRAVLLLVKASALRNLSLMSSKKQLWLQARRLGPSIGTKRQQASSICPFCSLSPAPRPTSRPQRATFAKRHQSTAANARSELERLLLELQNQAPDLINTSRLQLALQGLRQSPGNEAVRIAILGWDSGDGAGETAKRILRALLSDPLVDQEPWETELDGYDPSKPLIVRIRPSNEQSGLTLERDGPLNELFVSSAALGRMNLEILLMDADMPKAPGEISIPAVEEAIQSPMVDMPSTEDRFTPIATPVHGTILVGNGFSGAVNLSTLPLQTLENSDAVISAANMEGLTKLQLDGATFEVVDVAMAEKAVAIFRQGPQHAMEYEQLWNASNMSVLASWLRSALEGPGGTKPAVRKLVASLLQGALASAQSEEARKLSRALTVKTLPEVGELNQALAQWSQSAHSELQSELDLAFTGRRWRKLGWWKLFWRVDDVAMLTNEMLSQRFLPTAEQELVYLTGRIAGPKGEHPEYSQPISSREAETLDHRTKKLGSGELAPVSTVLPRWPGHIAFTRRYLQNETIPALQALAQNLVLQSLGTSGVATSLAAMLYISSFASTLYEAGGVAALGIVYSLSRMQKQWETARSFWEGDVREEGRKAVRAAEESIAGALNGEQSRDAGAQEKLERVKELITKAEDALARMK